jgi:hypothetical protein
MRTPLPPTCPPGMPHVSSSADLEALAAAGLGGFEGLENAADVPEGKPSRHLWLGNIPLKPNKLAMELLFA